MGIPLTQIDGERLLEKMLSAAPTGATPVVETDQRGLARQVSELTPPERETLRTRLGTARGPVDLRQRLTSHR